MRIRVLSAVVALLLVGGGRPAFADLKLEFKDGFVSLDAKNVTARQILAEWARLGGTKIVNGERIAGAPLTLQLVHVPERQALEIVLRSVSGYMAAPRPVANAGGASMFDRILVMPTSSVPASAPRTPAPANTGFPQGSPPPFPGRYAPPRPGMMPAPGQVAPIAADEPGQEEESDGADNIAPSPESPIVTMPGQMQRPFMPPGGVFGGVVPPQQNATPQPTTPGMPSGTSVTPGVIIQPPAPRPPGA